MAGAVSPYREPVKVKSVAINVNAIVDVQYEDDFNDIRNEETVKRQILDAIKQANIECTELVDIELEEIL
ncbi:hypothetical protein [Salinicoccus sp. HZC-1]|uniref:hypothetical protein n=1 Tax=Salinicoccus sp. HZC-1 TaxID=3385497 RepID=UPI00398B8B93